MSQSGNEQNLTIGGGCFWCLEEIFRHLKGVVDVTSGYAGGHVENPTYREVCNETTGHAEVVQITFEPEVITVHELLGIFFSIHDPTTPNRQGNDVGSQYRSIILYDSPQQEAAAYEVMEQVDRDHIWNAPLVTEVKPLERFFPAEREHERYYAQNSQQPYCQLVIAPKVRQFRQQFADKLVDA